VISTIIAKIFQVHPARMAMDDVCGSMPAVASSFATGAATALPQPDGRSCR
jgi:hypothetical protein